MSGARSIVVAGLDLAGVGFPQSVGVSFPRGLDQCLFVDAVSVHFPGYKGRSLLRGLPWVPVACVWQQRKISALTRVDVPLKLSLAFAGWTRVVTWSSMAFAQQPPIEDFLATRFTPEFRARESFLASRAIDESEHVQQHQRSGQKPPMVSSSTWRRCCIPLEWPQSLTAARVLALARKRGAGRFVVCRGEPQGQEADSG